MSKNQKLGCKAENPIVQILVKHLKVEAEIFEAKNDIYSLNWATLALINVNKEDDEIIKSGIISLENEANKIIYGKEFGLTSELIIKFALGIKILALRREENLQIIESMKILIKQLEEKNWFNSQETVSMLLFLLSDVDNFNSELNKASEWLDNRCKEFIKDRNYQNAIDASFGLSFCKNQIKLPSEEIIKILDAQSIERISKFLIYLHRNQETEYLKDVISLLENKLNDKFEDWVFPNLEMSLFEGINLANSNLPKEDILAIMDNFRKNDVKWAKFIDIGGNGLLLKNIHGITKIPAFNVKEDALSLLAILETERKTIYQLNEEEYESASKAIREHKDGYIGIKRKHINYFFHFSLILMVSLFLFSTYSIGILSNLISELLKTPSIYFLAKSFGFCVIFVVLMVFYYRIGDYLISNGEITKKELILLFPGVGAIYSWIRGEKNED